MQIYLGVDLAWGEKNPSGFCALAYKDKKLEILDIKLLNSIEEILQEVQKYDAPEIYLGIDAPLVVPNEFGNREIEKKFNKDFSHLRIAMLPVNRKLLTKYSAKIRSEILFSKLEKIGFQRDMDAKRVVFEVYTHSTVAFAFNSKKILPYKRKKGRDTLFIKEQLYKYREFYKDVVLPHHFLQVDIYSLKGASLKGYEDMLDALTCGYTFHYIQKKPYKIYTLDNIPTFLTPIEETYK
jgi:predicted RNase H-like nuclease